MEPPSVRVNGRPTDPTGVPDDERLLDTLRWRLGLRGTKEGCRSGSCGACVVLVDGQSALSCLTLTHELDGSSVTTIESLPEDTVGQAVRDAFVQEGASQCGYCIPGFEMALAGILRDLPPSAPVTDVVEELGGNLCRCTGYGAIVRAAVRAREAVR